MTRVRPGIFSISRGIAAVCACAMLATLGIGCEHELAPATPAPAATPVPFQRSQHLASGDAFLDVVTSLDRTELTVADRARLSVTCTTRSAATLTLPEMNGQLGDLTVVSSSRHERLLESNRREVSLEIVLEPFLAGDKSLPALTVQADDANRPLKIVTDPVMLHVAAVADDKADAKTPLEGAKSPVDFVVPSKPNRWGLLITLGCSLVGVVAALGFAAFASSRRARRERSPTFRVRRSLGGIRDVLARSSTVPEAAVACEGLFRAFAEYLHQVLGIPADTQPHAQVAPLVVTCDRLALADRNDLNTLLIDMERARFAPDGVSVPIVRSLLDRATAFVDRTATLEVPT